MQIPDPTPAQVAERDGGQVLPATPRSGKAFSFRTPKSRVAFALALVLYAVLALLASRHPYFAWDLSLDRWIQSISVPGFQRLMKWVSVPGTGATPFVLVILTAIVLFIARLRVAAAICAIGAALGSILDTLLKELSDRPRPASSLVQVLGHYDQESFPSGHVFFYVEFFGFLLFLSLLYLKPGLRRRVVVVMLSLLIALIGVSRVYLGAHWPSDVVGAYLGGGIWLWIMIATYRRVRM